MMFRTRKKNKGTTPKKTMMTTRTKTLLLLFLNRIPMVTSMILLLPLVLLSQTVSFSSAETATTTTTSEIVVQDQDVVIVHHSNGTSCSSSSPSSSSSLWEPWWDIARYDELRNDGGGGGRTNTTMKGGSCVAHYASWRKPTDAITTAASSASSTASCGGGDDHSVDEDEGDVRLCHLVAMLPFSNSKGEPRSFTFDDSPSLYLALHHFNRRIDTVVPELSSLREQRCNVRLTMGFVDTETSSIVANRRLIDDVLPSPPQQDDDDGGGGDGASFVGTTTMTTARQQQQQRQERPKPCGIVGAVWSAVSGPLSILAGGHDIPVMSHISTSTILDNQGSYRYFMRTTPSDAGVADAAISFLSDVMNCTHVAHLFARDETGLAFDFEFVQSALEKDTPMTVISVAYEGGDNSSMIGAIRQLRDSGYNYFYISPGPSDFAALIRYAGDLIGPGKFWLTNNVLAFIKGESYNRTTEADFARGLSNIWILFQRVVPSDSFDREWKQLVDNKLFRQYLANQSFSEPFNVTDVLAKKPSPTGSESMIYDAVIAYGMAMCKSPNEFFDGSSLLHELRQLSFHGASGVVKFDNRTGTRDSKTLFYRVKRAVPSDGDVITFTGEDVAETLPSSVDVAGHVQLSWNVVEPALVFADGSTNPPPPLPPRKEKKNKIPNYVRLLGISLAGVAMLMSIGWAAWVIVFRRYRVVRRSQPFFYLMLCVGTFVMASSIIPMSLQEPTSQSLLDAASMAAPWLFQMGFVVSFSALFSKVFQFNEMSQTARGFQRLKVPILKVLIPFTIFSVLSILTLTSWTVAYPMRWKRVYVDDAVDKYGRPIESYARPFSSDNFAFGILLLIMDIFALSFALWESYLSRNVHSEYNDSFYVTVSIATVLQSFLIGVPSLLILPSNPTAIFAIRSVLVVIVCFAVLLPIFVPKEKARRKSANAITSTSDLSLKPIQMTWSEVVRTNGGDGSSGGHSSNGSDGSNRPVRGENSSSIYRYVNTLSAIDERSGLESESESCSDFSSSNGNIWNQGLDQLVL